MLKKAIASFTFGQLQDAATLIRVLRRKEIALDDFLAYVDGASRQQQRETDSRDDLSRHLPRCPECDTPMVPREAHPPDPESADPGDPEEGSYWACQKCRFSRFDARPLTDIQTELQRLARNSSRRRAGRERPGRGQAGCGSGKGGNK